MKKKLNSREEQQQTSHQHTEEQNVREFATPEELLRHDALHTPVPPAIAARLQQSVGSLASKQPRPWWRKWLS